MDPLRLLLNLFIEGVQRLELYDVSSIGGWLEDLSAEPVPTRLVAGSLNSISVALSGIGAGTCVLLSSCGPLAVLPAVSARVLPATPMWALTLWISIKCHPWSGGRLCGHPLS